MPRVHFLTGLMAVAVSAGCMTGPEYVRPDVTVPDQWSASREGGETDAPVTVVEWWKGLNDPTLTSLVERAVASNHDLRLAEARVREARAARGIAASPLWPMLNASGAYVRSQSVEPDIGAGPSVTVGGSVGPGGISPSISVRGQNVSLSRIGLGDGATTSIAVTPGGATDYDRYSDLFQVGFDAAWELDVFGGNRRGVEAAEADIQASEEARRAVLTTLLSEIALNYVEVRSAQARLAIAHRNIEAQAGTVRLTRERFNAGLTSELDAIRAEALLTRTQSQIPMLETQRDLSIHRLGVLLGREPGGLKEELVTEASLPTAPDTVPVGLPSDLLRRRPDIRRAERALAASTARVGQATADLFPKFALTGRLAGQSGSFGDLLNSGSRVWSIGPGISWPIFQGGAIRANIEVQNARQEQAAIAYEQAILRALEDVENGLVAFAKEQVRRQALEATVMANERAVRLANERYIQGLETFLNVLQAQQELYNSEDLLVQSQSFVLTDLVALYKALGGGWEALDPEPTPAAEP